MSLTKDDPGANSAPHISLMPPRPGQWGSVPPAMDTDALARARAAQRRALDAYLSGVGSGPHLGGSSAHGGPVSLGDAGSANAVEHMLGKQDLVAKLASQQTDNSPLGDLQSLLDLGGLSQEDAQRQAQAMFKPQLGFLDELMNQARGNAAQSDTKLQQLYNAVQQGYVADQKPTAAIYDNASAAVGNAYDQGVAANNKAQDEVAARTAAMMKKLGIEQAGGELFKQNVADTVAADQRLNAQKATDQAGQAQVKAASLADLGVKRQAAGLEGADQRSHLQGQLQDILAGYGMKKADLQGQIASAAQQILQGSQKNQADMIKQLMDAEQQRFTNDLATKNYELNQDKFFFQKQQAQNAPSNVKLSPFEDINAAAAQAYGAFGTGQTGADNGVKAITDAARYFQSANGGRQPANAQDFLNYVRQRNPNANDIRILMDLAQRYYNAYYG